MSGPQDAPLTDRIAVHLRRGELLDLAPDLALGSVVEETVMRSWDEAHSIDADDLRDLLRGRVVIDPDPRGLRVRAARIRGRLDLDNLSTTVRLTLLDCLLDEGITAEAAHLPGLSLRRCLLTTRSKPAVSADELRTNAAVFFEGSTIRADTVDGAIRMIGARIGGALVCSGATIINHSGPALRASGLQVAGRAFLHEGFTAEGAGELGAVRLLGARIGGLLDCSTATITNPSGPALYGERLEVNDNVYLSGGFTAEGAGELGAVRLLGARIGGTLDCSTATITNHSGPALRASALQVAGRVFLREGFTAEGAGELGAVRLRGARVGGHLSCLGAIITNPSGPALHGDRLEVNDSVSLRDITAQGVGELGTVRLIEARISGHLSFSGTTITNPSGPALHGDRLQVNDNVQFSVGFTAKGAGELGAVRLRGAQIDGLLDFSGATIRNPSGPALRASALQVAGRVFLRGGFTAEGAGRDGAIRINGARIGGHLDCSGATITNPSGPALQARRLQVSADVILRADFIAEGHGERGVVRLLGARIGGSLDCSGAKVKSRSEDPRHRWSLDGLTYTGLPLDPRGNGQAGWLDLFRTATPAYAAQPYQQLASVYRAAGHDGDVRQILIAQRQAQLDRGVLSGRERLWARITGITLGYGYQPWRALLLLLGVVITSVVLAVSLGAHGALAHLLDPKNPTAAIPCAVTERVGVGLEVGAPFLDTHSQDRCTIINTATGTALSYSTWGLQLLAGALAALFIAGFTGIVRKT